MDRITFRLVNALRKSLFAAFMVLLPAGLAVYLLSIAAHPGEAEAIENEKWKQLYAHDAASVALLLVPTIVFLARFVSTFPPQRMHFATALTILSIVAIAFRYMGSPKSGVHIALILGGVIVSALLLIWRGFGPPNHNDPLIANEKT